MRQRYGTGQCATRDSREHKRNVEIIAECVGGKRGLEKRRGDRLNMAKGGQRCSVSTTSVCSPVVGQLQ